MPVSKKRYSPKRKKRTKRIKPNIGGGHTAHFKFYGLKISDEIINAFHDNGITYFHSGREDKANDVPTLTLENFIKKFELPKTGLPAAFNMTIIRAQHSQYIDGYKGAEYHDRITFERDF